MARFIQPLLCELAMKHRVFAAALFVALAAPAFAQAAAPPVPVAKDDLVPVAIDTSPAEEVV